MLTGRNLRRQRASISFGPYAEGVNGSLLLDWWIDRFLVADPDASFGSLPSVGEATDDMTCLNTDAGVRILETTSQSALAARVEVAESFNLSRFQRGLRCVRT